MFLPWLLGEAVEIEFHCSDCCLYFALILSALVLLIWMWRHGSHVGRQEQKDFFSQGTKLYFRYFYVNSSRKNSIVLTPKAPWPPCLCGCKLTIDLYCSTPYVMLKFSYLLFTSVGTWSCGLNKMTHYHFRLKSILIMYSFKNSNLVCLVKQNHEQIFLKLSC